MRAWKFLGMGGLPRALKPGARMVVLAAALTAALTGAQSGAAADIEGKDADGRPVLLKDDGSWRYLDDQGSAASADGASSAPQDQPTAELKLLRRVDFPGACRFDFELANTLPYEIHSLVPYFAVLRANGVVYATESLAFGPIKPGDANLRALRFNGIECRDIAKLKVQGGDRCEMGDLNKFSDVKGQCLARLRVLPSEVLSMEK